MFGWHDLTARLIPAMRAQGQGRIVSLLRNAKATSHPPIAAPIARRNSPSRRLPMRSASSLPPPASRSSSSSRDRSPRASWSTRSKPIGATSISKARRTVTSTAPGSHGSKRAAARPSSSGPRRSPPSSSSALASKRPKATLLRHAADLCRGADAPRCCRRAPSTPSPLGIRLKQRCCGRSASLLRIAPDAAPLGGCLSRGDLMPRFSISYRRSDSEAITGEHFRPANPALWQEVGFQGRGQRPWWGSTFRSHIQRRPAAERCLDRRRRPRLERLAIERPRPHR